MKKNETKKPTFLNEQNLIHCLNTPHCYFDDEGLGSYDKQEVLDLIEDVQKFHEFFMQKIDDIKFGTLEFLNKDAMKKFMEFKEQEGFTILAITSNVWCGILHFHKDIVPQKYLDEIEEME